VEGFVPHLAVLATIGYKFAAAEILEFVDSPAI